MPRREPIDSTVRRPSSPIPARRTFLGMAIRSLIETAAELHGQGKVPPVELDAAED